MDNLEPEPEQCREKLVFNGGVFRCAMNKGHPGNHMSSGIETLTQETHLIEWGTKPGTTVLTIDFSTYVALFMPEMLDKASALQLLAELLYIELQVNE